MASSRITYLFKQYESGNATEEEKAELLSWFSGHYNKEAINEYFIEEMQKEPPAAEFNEEGWQPFIEKILAEKRGKIIAIEERKRRLFIRRIAAAAAVLLLVAAGYWLFIQPSKGKKSNQPIVSLPNDIIAPQTNRATIVLADGKKVYLDSAGNGQLATQANVQLLKLADGKIVYQAQQQTANSQQLSYNTLTNPRGSKVITITLADGSHVWLNTGSSITYPVVFIGKERKVTITGEAYFEIAHDVTRPFYVSKGNMQVQVLGTHFNVNAYDDEDAVRVTLLEGSVRVKSESQEAGSKKYEVMIKPGQQAVLTPNSELKTQNNIDLEQVVAWKNGQFILKGIGIAALMRQVARWYDVDVVFAGKIPERNFGGAVNREVNLSTLLQALQEYNVKCRLEGKKVIIE